MDIAMEKWNRGQKLIKTMRKIDKIKFYVLCFIGFSFSIALMSWVVYRILTVNF